MYQHLFQRYEMKYLLTGEQKEALQSEMQEILLPDDYGRTTIQNIYYDTADDRIIRTSLEKPVYKEKLRMRSYGSASGKDPVFVEIKKKYKGIVYKRRIRIALDAAQQLLREEGKVPEALSQNPQIEKEIGYFFTVYPGLHKKIWISYEREAFFGREDENFRVTFDENLQYRREDLSLQGGVGEALLKDKVLMEVKVPGALPLRMVKALQKYGIQECGFSKYGEAYQREKARRNVK